MKRDLIFTILFPFLLVASVSFAQDEAGEEGESTSCDGNELVFYDEVLDEVHRIDCFELDGVCGLLNQDWGYDCLLSEDMACDHGYAYDASRCDPSIPLFCNSGLCSTIEPEPSPVLEAPADASGFQDRYVPSGSCLGCQSAGTEGLFFVLFLILASSGRKLRRRLHAS